MPWFYHTGRWLIRRLTILIRLEVRGGDNIPDEGPLIVVSNHMSLADPPMLGATIPRKTVFMAKEELFHHGLLSYFVKDFGAFPVRRGSPAISAVSQAREVLSQGLTLVIFPEGMRSKSGHLKEAFPGAALIAARTGAPILPVGISGTEKIRGAGWMLHRPEVRINIGEPFRLELGCGEPNKTQLREMTDDIMRHIAALLPPQYRGRYGERVTHLAN